MAPRKRASQVKNPDPPIDDTPIQFQTKLQQLKARIAKQKQKDQEEKEKEEAIKREQQFQAIENLKEKTKRDPERQRVDQ